MKLVNKLKNIKNKKVAIIAGALAFCSLIAGITAYLTDADRARNKITIGGSNITIEEGFIPPPELAPGVTFTKNVRVTNDGPSACYVRVMAVFTTSDMEKYCEVDWNTEDWVFNAEDNYWYYPESIKKGEKTPSLFTKVKVKEKYDFNGDGTLGDEEGIPESVMQDFDIIVYAESYQSAGFTGDGKTYKDAWAHYQANKPKPE